MSQTLTVPSSASGVWYALAAYAVWGLFPLYWRLFPHVPALQLLAHRIVWSFVALAAIVLLSWRRRGARFAGIGGATVALYAVAAALIGVNWFLYVYAVNADLVVETSLGYFITPLVNVLLGVFVFGERLRPLQWTAVVMASAGVVGLTFAYGTVPWIALGLAVSFGSYGLVKKKATLPSLDGLAVETGVLLLPAAAVLAVAQVRGTAAFLAAGTLSDVLLVAGGVVTICPLLLFATAVQRVPLSVIGILQYLAPTIQFLLGVFVFHEPFSRPQLSGFLLVWAGLVLFAVDGLHRRASTTSPAAAGGT